MKPLLQIWNGKNGFGTKFTIIKLTNKQYEKIKHCNIKVLKDFCAYKIITITQNDYNRIIEIIKNKKSEDNTHEANVN